MQEVSLRREINEIVEHRGFTTTRDRRDSPPHVNAMKVQLGKDG